MKGSSIPVSVKGEGCSSRGLVIRTVRDCVDTFWGEGAGGVSQRGQGFHGGEMLGRPHPPPRDVKFPTGLNCTHNDTCQVHHAFPPAMLAVSP